MATAEARMRVSVQDDATLKLKALQKELTDLKGGMDRLGQAGLAFGSVGIVGLLTAMGNASLDAYLQVEKLNKAYNTIAGSTAGADAMLAQLRGTTDALGLSFLDSAEQAKGFFASVKGTVVQGEEAIKVFTGMSEAGAALGLSTVDMDRAFRALGQMAGKGKIMAEELRGQMGEVVPGAFQTAARAMGVTTTELDKLMSDGKIFADDFLPRFGEQLRKEYGEKAREASDNVQASINRASSAWTEFKANVLNSDAVIATLNAVGAALNVANDAERKISERNKTIQQMEKAGIEKKYAKSTYSYGLLGDEHVSVQLGYSEEQIEQYRQNIKTVEELNQDSQEASAAAEKAMGDNRKAINEAWKKTTEGQRENLKEEHAKTLKAFDDQINDYKQQGTSIDKLLEQRAATVKAHQKKLADLDKKGEGKDTTSAKRALESVNAEIAKMLGKPERFDSWLSAELMKIAKSGKDAGLSLSEITAKQQEFSDAAAVKRVRDYGDAIADTEAKIASMMGDDTKSRSIGLEKDLETLRLKLTSLSDGSDEAKAKIESLLAGYKESSQKQIQVKDMQAAANFMKEMVQLSGQYGMEVEAVNSLLEVQAEILRQNLPDAMKPYVDEWLKLQKLQNARDYFSGMERGARRYLAEVTNSAKQADETIYGVLTGMEDGMVSVFDTMMETGELKFDDMGKTMRKIMLKLLSDLARMAITNMVTVPITTALFGGSGGGGAGGTGIAGMARAAGAGASGGGMDLLGMATNLPLGRMLPGGGGGSWLTSGLDSLGASLFPSVFGETVTPITEGMSLVLPPNTTFTGAFGAPFVGGGLGMMASPFVNDLLGIQNNTGSQIGSAVGGLGATAVLGTLAAANIWNPVGWVSGAIAGISALLGGAAGGLLGFQQPEKPRGNVWSISPISEGFTGFNSNFTAVAKDGFNATPYAQIYHKGGKMIWDAIDKTVSGLPDELQKRIEEPFGKGMVMLSANPEDPTSSLPAKYWTKDMLEMVLNNYMNQILGHLGGVMAGTDYGFMVEEGLGQMDEKAASKSIGKSLTEMFNLLALGDAFDQQFVDTWVAAMGSQFKKAFGDFDLSKYISVDLAGLTQESAKNLAAGLNTMNNLITATEELIRPATAAERQANEAKKQLEEYKKALQDVGLTQSWVTSTMEDYRQAVVENVIDGMLKQIHPVNAFTQALEDVNNSVTGAVNALRTLVATEEEVARVEAERQGLLQKTFNDITRGYQQDYATRYAALTGRDQDFVKAEIGRENELLQVEQQYGKGTNFTLTMLQKVADLNAQKFQGKSDWDVQALDQAIAAAGLTRQSWYDQYGRGEGYTAGMDFYGQTQALQKAEAAQLLVNKLTALQQKTLQTEISAAQKLISAWESVVDALDDGRKAIWQDNTDPEQAFASVYAEFNRLYEAALGGDSEAAAEMGNVASEVLNLGKLQAGSQSIYQQLFNDVDRKLFDMSIYASDQYDVEQAQLDALQKQLDELTKGNEIAQSSAEIQKLLLAAQADLAKSIAELAAYRPNYGTNAPGSNGGGLGTPGGGTGSLSMDQILQAKLDALNRGESLTPGQVGGGWTMDSLLGAISGSGETPQSWWDKYGKDENLIKGFATGGVTPANTLFTAHERGRELFMSPKSWGVLNNEKSLRLLESLPGTIDVLSRLPAMGTDGSARAENALLREEVRSLNARIDRLVALTESVVRHTRDSADNLDSMSVNGIQTREYAAPEPIIPNFPD